MNHIKEKKKQRFTCRECRRKRVRFDGYIYNPIFTEVYKCGRCGAMHTVRYGERRKVSKGKDSKLIFTNSERKEKDSKEVSKLIFINDER